MEFQDKVLSCVDCGAEFIWTSGEQLFFADKQFKNEPKRCKTCKAKRANRAAAGTGRAESCGDADHLFGVRQGHDRPVPAHAGTPGLLQGVFPAAEVRGRRRRLSVRRHVRGLRGPAHPQPGPGRGLGRTVTSPQYWPVRPAPPVIRFCVLLGSIHART